MSNFGDFSTRSTVEDTDLFTGHRGTTTVSGVKPESKWTWATLRTALASLFAPIAHASATDNPHAVTKTQVGLGNVDNTSDVNKPVSTAQATAIGLKLDASQKAAVNGVASLGSDGKVPTGQLPDIAAGSATSIRKTVTQAAHGFTAKQVVYDNNGTWALARADNINTSRVTGIIESATTNDFVVVQAGNGAFSGLVSNTQYYLSGDTAGLITSVPPSNVAHFVVTIMRTGAAGVALVEIGEPLSLALIPNSALASDAARPAQASAPEIAAGTEATLRSFSVANVKSMIDTHAPAGGASFVTGVTMFNPVALSVPAGWSLAGANGVPAFTSPDTDFVAITKLAGTVADPVFSPAAGTYGTTQSVTITCATPSSAIRYTTDGSTPTRSTGTVYSGAISVPATATLKAIAYRDYYADSAVVTAAYTITVAGPTLTSATINPAGTQLTLVFSASVTVGAGGNGGFVLDPTGADVTLTYVSGSGSNTLVYSISRAILRTAEETAVLNYTQPGDGIEATSGGVDVATFTSATVTNNSTQSSGTAYEDEVLADSPVGYWRLGETSGTSAADLGSAAQAGTYSGGYTLNQTSLLASDAANKSVLLNGSSGYIDCTASGAFSFAGGNMTGECVAKFNAFPGSGDSAWLFGKAYDGGSSKVGYSLRLEVSGAVKTLKVESYDGSTAHGATFDVSAWTTGTIYHIAFTYDGTNWKLYVNGSVVASTAGSGPQSSSRPRNIGRESTTFGDGAYFNGTIDEVALYGTALSAGRISAHYAAV